MKVKKTRIFTIVILLIAAIITVNLFIIHSTAATAEEVYQRNLKIYNNQKTDFDTLEYYKQPQNGIESDAKEIIDLAKSITIGISNHYDKAKAIHDWVANNFYYDWDMYYNNNHEHISALDTLYKKHTVCEGYINLTVGLLRAIDIPAKYISGYTALNNNENHAWCEAFIDGKWIIIDTTWDSNNSYEKGVYSDKISCSDTYFDISLKDFSATHEYRDYSFVGLSTFRNCDNLTNISIPYGFNAIEDFAFRECTNLTSVNIPDSVIKIGWGAFYNCKNLKNISIPGSVRSIRDFAFSGCENLTNMIILNNITSIGECTFQGCINLTTISLPSSVNSIEKYAFSGCENLTNIIMPENIASIGDRAFWFCINLTEIALPGSVRHIGESVFDQCENLTIYGESGSVAESYAKENNIKFITEIPARLLSEENYIVSDYETPLADVNFYNIGDPLGDVLYSDITAYINGHAIPTSIVDGVTLVVVEDLARYGFNVDWDNNTKALKIDLNKNKRINPLSIKKDINYKPGTFKCKYVYTDIKTYISDEIIESYAINGVTLIDFESLAKYGKFTWNGITRELKLTID